MEHKAEVLMVRGNMGMGMHKWFRIIMIILMFNYTINESFLPDIFKVLKLRDQQILSFGLILSFFVC